MQELIKISTNDKGQQVVSAKDLHRGLKVSTDFTTWCKRMFDYGFEEDLDFTPFMRKSTGGRPSVDYVLTIDCAKEISMLQRSKIGKLIRKYFIECERKLIPPKQLSRKELAYMVIEAEEKAERLQLEIDTKHKPRSEFVDQVFGSDSLITVGQASKSLGLGFGRNTLFKKLRERGVLFKNTNEPKQEFVDRGYFKVKEKVFTTDDGKTKIKLQTFVTQKGLGYIAKIFNVINLPVNNGNKPKYLSA